MSPALRAAGTALAVLALAGCGGGASAGPARHRVEIRNFVFAPARETVKAGDQVVFVNHDAVPHTATAADGAWDTGNLPAGDSAVVTVKGAAPYKCAFHPNMTGALVE